jgi:protein disulfide-isomerase-like protein
MIHLRSILLVTLACVVAAANSSVVLTKKNFDKLTAGKTVFIKFFAPWCGHCQELAPNWEKMASEWTESSQGLVGQVDCTTDEDLCKVFDIKGLPTLLYGDPSKFGVYLETYQDEKTYEALSQFANETLAKPMCSPANLAQCNADMRMQIESVLKLSKKELEAKIQEKEQAIEDQHKEFQKEYKVMQTKYDKLATQTQTTKARIKDTIRMLKAVQEAKNQ